jgi:zinc protease
MRPPRRRASSLVTLILLALAAGASVGALHAQDIDVAPAAVVTLDRTKPPAPLPVRPLPFPAVVERTLANGIPISIMEDHTRPVVSVSVILRISSLTEPPGKAGLGRMVAALLGEGTTTHTADQLSEQFGTLGNSVSATGFYTIRENVDESLALMAEQFLNPAFPQAALDRHKAQVIAELQRARDDPGYVADRIVTARLYGEGHPYARRETPASIRSITRDDVVGFHRRYYRPPNVRIVVAGDISADQAVMKLDRTFGQLAAGTSGDLRPPRALPIDSLVVYLYDRPGSAQSSIVAARFGPPRGSPDRDALELLNTVLGGAFNSRLNLSLREQHHFAYFAQSSLNFPPPPEPATFMARTEVATAKTDSAVAELLRVLDDVRREKPVTADELAFARATMTRDLPLRFETIGRRAEAVADLVRRREPPDYYRHLVEDYQRVTLAQIRRVARDYITTGKMVLVVVGDRHAIEARLRALKLAPVVVIPPLPAD